MATDVLTHSITPEQFAAMPGHKDYELVDGHLVERKMGNKASWVAFELAHYLRRYALEHNLGWVFCGGDSGFRLFVDGRQSIRKPDVSFIRFGRLPNEEPADTYDAIAPDLAVEVISPNDTVLELEEKIEEYLQSGVRLVWVINPELRTLTAHRLHRAPVIVRSGGKIDGEDVVPGFGLPLSDLFEMPKP
jgi:Uma2 family endonuclease